MEESEITAKLEELNEKQIRVWKYAEIYRYTQKQVVNLTSEMTKMVKDLTKEDAGIFDRIIQVTESSPQDPTIPPMLADGVEKLVRGD